MSNKSLYRYKEEYYAHYQTLLLTDEQAAVFKWFQNQGYDFEFEKIDNEAPDEIDTEELIKTVKRH